MGELFPNRGHDEGTTKDRRRNAKTTQDVLLETMEEDRNQTPKSGQTGDIRRKSLGICKYKKGLLAYSQQPDSLANSKQSIFQGNGIANPNDGIRTSSLISIEPPYAERHVRWCERSAD